MIPGTDDEEEEDRGPSSRPKTEKPKKSLYPDVGKSSIARDHQTTHGQHGVAGKIAYRGGSSGGGGRGGGGGGVAISLRAFKDAPDVSVRFFGTAAHPQSSVLAPTHPYHEHNIEPFH